MHEEHLRIAEVIARKKPLIIEEWEKAVRSEIGVGEVEARPALLDCVPHILDGIQEYAEASFDGEFLVRAEKLGGVHGLQRLLDTDFSLGAMVHEYRLLCAEAFRALESVGILLPRERDALLSYFNASVQGAVRAFSDAQRRALQSEKGKWEKMFGELLRDLLDPLSAAEMTLNFMYDRQNQTFESNPRALERVRSHLARAREKVARLLGAGKKGGGSPHPLEIGSWCLLEVVENAIADLRERHPANPILLSDSENFYGEWDASALKIAIGNIVDNAVEHGEAGGPIVLSVRSTRASVMIIVHVQGPPIPEETLRRVFGPEPHERGPRAVDAGRGWALGLARVRMIVTAHQGRMRVESREGVGTTFTLELPWKSRATSHVEIRIPASTLSTAEYRH